MKKNIVGILTGDIVNSRKVAPDVWQEDLKKLFNRYGDNPLKWEIFRGDTFQLETSPKASLRTAIEIKAQIKTVKVLDVRIAIGIGKQEYATNKITESNGEAYNKSGMCFEQLKKRRLALKTPWQDFDDEWNLYLILSSMIMDNWSPKAAHDFKEALLHPSLTQTELGVKLKRNQSTISENLKRAGYDEIQMMNSRFEQQITKKLNGK